MIAQCNDNNDGIVCISINSDYKKSGQNANKLSLRRRRRRRGTRCSPFEKEEISRNENFVPRLQWNTFVFGPFIAPVIIAKDKCFFSFTTPCSCRLNAFTVLTMIVVRE